MAPGDDALVDPWVTQLRALRGTRADYAIALAAVPDELLPQVLEAVGGKPAADVAPSPLAQAIELDPLYVARPHLQYLSDRLVRAHDRLLKGESTRIAVSMPPRSGKSTAISTYLPLWLLRQNPTRKIGLISHDPTMVTGWGRTIRNLIENHPELGLAIQPDAGAASEWQTTRRGGVISRSVGQSVVGRGFNVIILDDVVRDFAAAHSEANRRSVWEWWTANAYTRLEPPFIILAVGCLTAETPVLMADGTEKRIDQVRPGDHVASYQDGRTVAAEVLNWANQGPDHVYTVRMESGRKVTGNARHPFRIIENGEASWRRLRDLRPGDVVRTADPVKTATSSSATVPPSNDFWRPLNTYAPGTDRVASITLDGYEDVFDIEVDHTHNFIADGVEVSNTRWHEDDFIGRLLSDEYEGDPTDWDVVSFPAIAEEADVLGRAPGDPLLSPLIPTETPAQALVRWDEMKRTVGTYNWVSQFQGRPAPAEGAVFNMGWWRYWTTRESLAADDGTVRLMDFDTLVGGTWIDSWDAAFKGTDGSDFVVGQRWVRSGANRFLVDQVRARMSFTQTLTAMRGFQHPRVHVHLIEDKANGPAIIDTLREEVAGLKPVNPTNSKEARARAVTPEVESGNVYLPHPVEFPWVADLLSELRSFPQGAHDDQVDAMSQALWELRDGGAGGVTNLARREMPLGGVGRGGLSRAAAARTMRRR